MADAKIIVAVYDAEGKMLNLKISHIEDDAVFTGLPYGAVVKAYLWQGTTPLCDLNEYRIKK